MFTKRIKMLTCIVRVTVCSRYVTKHFSTTLQRTFFKVALCGAAGGIGQPLAMLLKMNPLVTELSVFDVNKVLPGVAVDLSHINSATKVSAFVDTKQLTLALEGAHVVVIPAGIPRKPGMSRDDLFKTNATIIRDIVTEVSCVCPDAILAIITNPVNSMVPIACEIMKKAKVLDPNKVFGVTTLDVVRACTFIGEINCIDPKNVDIPVIGGHAGITIIPVLSQSQPCVNLTDGANIMALTKRIQEAGTEVVKAKSGAGSATLSMAFAASRFTNSLLKGLCGEPNIVECAYVMSCVTESPYFANPLLLGQCGVEKNLGCGHLNAYEQCQVRHAVCELLKNVEQGLKFVHCP